MEQETAQSQINSGSSVAWFKLADLIARREREKALNVFRLLSHSLTNKAYVLQLEGDILWAMEDKLALDRYKQAAFLYQKEKRIIDAISIYENLIQLDPTQKLDFILIIAPMYALIDWPEAFDRKFYEILKSYNEKQLDEQRLCNLIKILSEMSLSNIAQKKWLHERMLKSQPDLPEQASEIIKELFFKL
jgi:tetratricopeptide (TPR) repeat protein